MGAKKDAKKRLAIEEELEKLRAKKLAEAFKLAAMEKTEQAKLNKRKKRAKILFFSVMALLVVTVVAVAIQGSKTQLQDPGASTSCEHFANVASDISKGLLTSDQVHTKLQQIYSDARVSSISGIASDAQAMLAADVAGDATNLANAINAFAKACTTAGY